MEPILRSARNISVLCLLCLLIFGTQQARTNLGSSRIEPSAAQKEAIESLYLPRASAVSTLSFGYRNLLANILWFTTINYFGQHHLSDQRYRWLAHRCRLMQSLNSRALHIVDFCYLMLSWEANEPELADEIVSVALTQHPDNWKLWYYRGFLRFYFLKDLSGAASDWVQASVLPDVHPLIIKLASTKLARLDSKAFAIQFLKERIRATNDPEARRSLEEKLDGMLASNE